MKKKLLLMGGSNVGKTSMRSIIFANYIALDTSRFGATIDVEHSHVKLLGNLVLNLWDCGGQETYMDGYIENQEENSMFTDVAVLIYVFDVESSDPKKELVYFKGIVQALKSSSPQALTYCLIHKMDLIEEGKREEIFHLKRKELLEIDQNLVCYRTSIWDETLFRAWSAIVSSLVPNIKFIELNLENFARICGADEVVLFEKATFLLIAHFSVREVTDIQRFEKISNIIKQFKISCKLTRTQMTTLEVKNSKFKGFVDSFTPNTYLMVVTSDQKIESETIRMNIASARKHFEKFMSKQGDDSMDGEVF